MSSVSFNPFAPPSSQAFKTDPAGHNEDPNQADKLYNAKTVLLDYLKRLDIDPERQMGLYDETLKHVARGGVAKDDDGNVHPTTPEVKEAAQTILDNGGVSSVTPNGESALTIENLQHSLANEPGPLQSSEPLQAVQPGGVLPAERGEIRI